MKNTINNEKETEEMEVSLEDLSIEELQELLRQQEEYEEYEEEDEFEEDFDEDFEETDEEFEETDEEFEETEEEFEETDEEFEETDEDNTEKYDNEENLTEELLKYYEDLKDPENISPVSREEIIEQMGKDIDVPEGKEVDTMYDSSGNPILLQVDGEMYTQEIPIKDILIPPRSRNLNRLNIEPLEQSIAKWGLITPLHVIPFKGKFLLVHGLRRLKALKNLGYDSCMCLVDTTRPKATVRFLEVISNNILKYNLFEMLDFGEFIEKKQSTFQHETIENIIGMEPGDYLKAKYIRNFDKFGIIGDVAKGKKSIKEGFKKLEKELEKEEKEKQKEVKFTEEGLTESYAKYLEEEVKVQDPKNREILPKHISDRIKARDKYICQSCGLGLNQPELVSIFEIHHIVPVAKGGGDIDNNLILLCSNCHKVVHAYAEGKFSPPKDRISHYHNMIVLGNIIKLGVQEGKTPLEVYRNECYQPWVE